MTMGPEEQLRYLNEEFAIMQARLKAMQEEQSALQERMRELWADRDWWRAIAQKRIRNVLNGETAKTITGSMQRWPYRHGLALLNGPPPKKRKPKRSKVFHVEP